MGIENDSTILGVDLSSAPFERLGTREVDIQRYIVGITGAGAPSSPSSISASAPSLEAAIGVGRSSAVDKALRLPLARDCFFNRRLIVSACQGQLGSIRNVKVKTAGAPSRPQASSP